MIAARAMPGDFRPMAEKLCQKDLMLRYRATRRQVIRWAEESGVRLRCGGGRGGKAVAQYDPKTGDLLAVYRSQTEAVGSLPGKAAPSAISNCCRGTAVTAYGYQWQFWRGAIPSQETIWKRRIYRRLAEFRDANGQGWKQALQGFGGPRRDILLGMLETKKYPVELWEQVEAALDRAETEAKP